MNEKIRDRIVQARVKFLLQQPFFGQLAVRLVLQECGDWCPTMAVDGYNLYYNPEFVNGMDDDEIQFVVAHEVMHCVYRHFLRRDKRDPRLWNCAGDYVINLELKDLRIGKMPPACKMPNWEKDQDFYAKMGIGPNDPGGLIDEKYRNMVTEEVYDLLVEDAKQNGKHADEGMNSMDMHLDPDGQGGGEGEDSDGDGNDAKKGRLRLSKDDQDRLEDELKKAVIDAVRNAQEGEGAGRIPGGALRLVKEWTESKVDWREHLTNVVLSTVKSDYTWQHSSRKGRDQGIYLPGLDNEDRVECHIAIDTSGSITAVDIKHFLSEVKGIMDQFSDFKITAWCFDSATYTIHEYTPENCETLEEFEPEGGGGTTFEVNWDLMKEHDMVPATFLMFTDGCPCGGWGDPDYCDTVFIIKDNPRAVAPFGTTVHYEE